MSKSRWKIGVFLLPVNQENLLPPPGCKLQDSSWAARPVFQILRVIYCFAKVLKLIYVPCWWVFRYECLLDDENVNNQQIKENLDLLWGGMKTVKL